MPIVSLTFDLSQSPNQIDYNKINTNQWIRKKKAFNTNHSTEQHYDNDADYLNNQFKSHLQPV